jgi:hypothetical protein
MPRISHRDADGHLYVRELPRFPRNRGFGRDYLTFGDQKHDDAAFWLKVRRENDRYDLEHGPARVTHHARTPPNES